ncbi:MAG: acyl carrier protein [Propionibacteriaceae bacterium]|jgi:acyl carrier protein|nr:acyl carrier protein [Propionibacteriaceae bacterium]
MTTTASKAVLDQVAQIVTEVAGAPVADVTLDKSFTDDLGVDSLSMVEIIYAVEDTFGITIPEEESKNLRTVGDAVAFIEAHQA